MRVRGPLADSYTGAAVMVVFALVPYLALTSAVQPLKQLIGTEVGLSPQALQNTSGMANAGYAFGTLLSVQLAVRLRPRRLLLLYVLLLVAASVVTAAAVTPAMFIAGHIVQGFCTSLLLIAAVPPLVTGWPAKRMPLTAGLLNLCVFGAVALGPVVGGLEAASHAWRPLFWMSAGASVIALVFVLLTWEDDPAPDPAGPWDVVSLTLAGFGCAAAFFGASELTTHRMLSLIVFLPLIAGAISVLILVVHQYGSRDPLVPVKELISTKPVAGIVAAMAAGASSLPAIDLLEEAAKSSVSPGHLANLLWPFLGGALLMAVVFGLLLKTRMLVVAVVTGLGLLAGGIAIGTGVEHGPHSLIGDSSALIGLGVGASVAPALFVAGFSVRAMHIQRVLALVELLRAVAAFMTGPVLLHLALTVDGGAAGTGIRTSLWICFAIACTGALVSLYILVLGRARLQQPDIERWQSGEGPAWTSPPLADGIRPHASAQGSLLTDSER